MFGLVDGRWFPMSLSALSLLQYVVLAEIYEENPASHRLVLGSVFG